MTSLITVSFDKTIKEQWPLDTGSRGVRVIDIAFVSIQRGVRVINVVIVLIQYFTNQTVIYMGVQNTDFGHVGHP